MKTDFSARVYLEHRYDWIVRQIQRATSVALPTLSIQEGRRHTDWLNEAVRLHAKGVDEKSAREILRLFTNISTQLEKHVPGVAVLTRELREAATK